MLILEEPDIRFIFKENTVIKYDESIYHKICKHTNLKGVDFIYKYTSKLLLVEVKDFNRNYAHLDKRKQENIFKQHYKTLGLNTTTPFETFCSNIIQKYNDTLLSLFSNHIIDNNDDNLSKITQQIQTIVFILVIDLPHDMLGFLNTISDKLESKMKKYKCLFDTEFILLTPNTVNDIHCFTIEKIDNSKNLTKQQ
jgi:hypothetical protein